MSRAIVVELTHSGKYYTENKYEIYVNVEGCDGEEIVAENINKIIRE